MNHLVCQKAKKKGVNEGLTFKCVVQNAKITIIRQKRSRKIFRIEKHSNFVLNDDVRL